MWLNQGKFMDNGGCGYVLKPEFLLPKGGVETVTFNPELATTPKQRLRVEVNEGRKGGFIRVNRLSNRGSVLR